jgi:hypothetical protein
VFANNRAAAGGGLHVAGAAKVNINSSIVSNNSADDGAAVLAEGNSTVRIFLTVISNHSNPGIAAVYVRGPCQLAVAHSTFTHNETPQNGYGGAMCLAGGSSSAISNSTFVSNVGGFGAAIFMQGVRLTVADSEFHGNEGTEGGVAHVKEDAQVRA